MNAPEVWWSPSEGQIEEHPRGGYVCTRELNLSRPLAARGLAELPADAVRLVPDTAGRCGDIGDLLFNERYCCELRAGHAGWHREGVTEWSGVGDGRAAGVVPDAGPETDG